jgi:hypothetical protein
MEQSYFLQQHNNGTKLFSAAAQQWNKVSSLPQYNPTLSRHKQTATVR